MRIDDRRSRAVVFGLLALFVLASIGCRRSGEGARLALAVTVPPDGFVWSGALTSRSVEVVGGFWVRDSLRLVVEPEPDTLRRAASAPFVLTGTGPIVRARLAGLEPGTRYTYAFESGGERIREGTFRTPEDGPFSFSVAVGACSLTGSSNPVFDVIRAADPLFFLHLGDLFYEDITVDRPSVYRYAYSRVLRSPAQARLYRSTPIVYMWDDHDYGPNNSDRLATGRAAAREAYETFAPHYPLADGAIYQAFTVGRVRFIVTDLRSARDPVADTPADERTIMGAEQKAWFKAQLLAANDRYPLIGWVNTVPWIGEASPTADHWGGYPAERREIADFIKDHGIDGVVIMGGDAHMVAMDDGSNSDYATGGGAPIPVIHTAPLDQTGSSKGGPYSEGAFPNPSVLPPHPGQWVEMAVRDEGGAEVCAEWTGYRTDWNSTDTEEIVAWGRCFEAEPVEEPAPEPSDTTATGISPEPSPPSITIDVGG